MTMTCIQREITITFARLLGIRLSKANITVAIYDKANEAIQLEWMARYYSNYNDIEPYQDCFQKYIKIKNEFIDMCKVK